MIVAILAAVVVAAFFYRASYQGAVHKDCWFFEAPPAAIARFGFHWSPHT